MSNPQEVIYVCQPSYGHGHKDSKKQFWSKASDPIGKYKDMGSIFDDYGSSLLADSFNHHWVNALNLQLQGKNITMFVMLHDDIVPEDFWLDKLIAELKETQADLVSVVVPIKDGRGLTSTAITNPYDKFDMYRRLTFFELQKLNKETFSIKDLQHLIPKEDNKHYHLAINTGCWICRFDKPWRFKVHFQIDNGITLAVKPYGEERMEFVSIKDKSRIQSAEDVKEMVFSAYPERSLHSFKFINRVLSEDWKFSKMLGELGADVRATFKVKLKHYGDFPYPNDKEDWGSWQEDEALRHNFSPYMKVRGFLTDKECKYLNSFVKEMSNLKVLEIGSWCGRSTICFQGAEKLVCIDTFNGDGMPIVEDTFEEFQRNMNDFGMEPIVHRKTSKQFYEEYIKDEGRDNFDIVFVDGSHDKASLIIDLNLAYEAVRHDGGLILVHDYNVQDTPDVKPTVDEFCDKYGCFQTELNGSIATIVVGFPKRK